MNSTGSDMSLSNTLKYMGWFPNTAIDEIVDLFEIDFEAAVPGELSSMQYFYGTYLDPPYGDGEAFVLDQTEGFSQLVRGMLEDDVPGM